MIKIIGRTNKSKVLYFCDYSPLLDKAINNWKGIPGCVKVMYGKVYINFTSLGYFTEMLSNEDVRFSVITTLN